MSLICVYLLAKKLIFRNEHFQLVFKLKTILLKIRAQVIFNFGLPTICTDFRKIRLKESNVKCRYLKKIDLLCWRPCIFSRSWTLCIWPDSEPTKVLYLPQWSPTHLNTPNPPPATHCLNILYFHCGKRGGMNKREGYWGNSSQKLGQNTNMTDCISSL